MVPESDYVSTESMEIPPNITALMPEKDWLSECDIFGLDFTPTIDRAIEATAYGFPEIVADSLEAGADETGVDAITNARRRHTIFQSSPW